MVCCEFYLGLSLAKTENNRWLLFAFFVMVARAEPSQLKAENSEDKDKGWG